MSVKNDLSRERPTNIQCFLENSAYVIDHDVIDFSSNFQKHPYGQQRESPTLLLSLVAENDASLTVSPIFCQVSIECHRSVSEGFACEYYNLKCGGEDLKLNFFPLIARD
ncbi:hypothetical protein TNCV_4694881 [Trichonephila clavipes]|nr:hypothetical protein TNCV_4694881 [Trichonephila clavipes]